ncbi:MAG: TraR/DksA family transcriptional regulator [Endomicrobium sp.]|jgi:DnaK suppressor protein|nr:TraR/DksA family transcriptional regulator [Endomicrobium sp.]
MNKKNIMNFKKILIQKKTEILNKTNNIEMEINTGLNISCGDEIDTASQNSTKEIYFELIENERVILNSINDALIKIEKNTYAKCENCNNIIPIERLKAIPWTKYCIKCQEKLENPKKRLRRC